MTSPTSTTTKWCRTARDSGTLLTSVCAISDDMWLFLTVDGARLDVKGVDEPSSGSGSAQAHQAPVAGCSERQPAQQAEHRPGHDRDLVVGVVAVTGKSGSHDISRRSACRFQLVENGLQVHQLGIR